MTGLLGMIDFLGGRGAQSVALAFHAVIFDLGCAYGLESTRADMQGQQGMIDALLAQLREKFRGKMKTRRRRGDGARMSRIDSLIALAIERFGFPRAPHIRW